MTWVLKASFALEIKSEREEEAMEDEKDGMKKTSQSKAQRRIKKHQPNI